jgi:hypothetical protein
VKLHKATEDYGLVGYDAVYFGWYIQTLMEHLLPLAFRNDEKVGKS